MEPSPLADHQRLIDQLTAFYRARDEVVAICLFGSFANEIAHSGSDIDIEIISRSGSDWAFEKRECDGIKIETVFISEEYFRHLIQKLPYICHIYLTSKALFDPVGLMHWARHELIAYYDKHPEVSDYWEDILASMRMKKIAGNNRMADIIEAYDGAELRFSPHGRITRAFLRQLPSRDKVRSRPAAH